MDAIARPPSPGLELGAPVPVSRQDAPGLGEPAGEPPSGAGHVCGPNCPQHFYSITRAAVGLDILA